MIDASPRVKSIWFTDDDPDDADILRSAILFTIPEALYRPIYSGDGLLAALIHHPPPDLLFLDLKMPVLDGKACLRQIRGTLKMTFPIVIYSGSPDLANIAQCYQLGADLYIQKPLRYHDIMSTIREVLEISWKDSRPSIHPGTGNRFIHYPYVS
ncbi:MAG TPA: response regulator [Flavisolibacter sp.]|jgi:CheY-like chemotaxis protein|nr:response regulator [Flavisolibacter sp.]